MSRAAFDWRLIVATTFMLMMSYVMYTGYAEGQENIRKGERINRLVKNQGTLLDNQELLLQQVERLRRRQTELLANTED